MNDTSQSAEARALRIAAMRAQAVQSAWEMYDRDRHLIYHPAAGQADIRVYRQASSLPLACALLQSGDARSIAEAGHIVEAVLRSQDTSPKHPHRGNWLWLVDDPEIGDLNAVQGDSGQLRAGSVTLETNPQPIWLLAQEIEPGSWVWIAVNPEERPTPLRWHTATGTITAESWELGRLEWRAPEGGEQVLIVQGVEELHGLTVPEGLRVSYQPP